jgi:PPOX class probable F420-dependent enzyme
MATRSILRNGQEMAVTETEDEAVQAVRRDHPNPVKLEGIDGVVLYVNWAHITSIGPGRRPCPRPTVSGGRRRAVPKPPLPPDLVAFLAEPNPSVIATIRPDGSPHTAATWYLWVDGRVLVNMDEGRRRLEHVRQEPRVSITVLGRADLYHHVTLRGHAAELMADPQFTDIDRLSEHYTGRAYPQRDRGRVSAWIEVRSWHAWAVIEPWTGGR